MADFGDAASGAALVGGDFVADEGSGVAGSAAGEDLPVTDSGLAAGAASAAAGSVGIASGGEEAAGFMVAEDFTAEEDFTVVEASTAAGTGKVLGKILT